MTIAIRAATPEDVPALADVAARAYRSAFAGIMEPHQLTLRDTAFFTARFAAEWPHLHLAEDRFGACLGFVEVRDGTLDMIFMDELALGSGLGARLLRQAEALGASRLECFRDNGRARRFYEREGWQLQDSYARDFAGRTLDFVTYSRAA